MSKWMTLDEFDEFDGYRVTGYYWCCWIYEELMSEAVMFYYSEDDRQFFRDGGPVSGSIIDYLIAVEEPVMPELP
ncbi:MAG: hypothetical protein JKY50_12895 [Oleispira sp.]|nr:hypothetical protein [Oleispira sp.]